METLTEAKSNPENPEEQVAFRFQRDENLLAGFVSSAPESLIRLAIHYSKTDKKRAKRLRAIAKNLLIERRLSERTLLDSVDKSF